MTGAPCPPLGLSVNMTNASLYRRRGKRWFDLLVAAPALLLALPAMGLVALCSLICLGRPLLFRQKRAGRQGAPFTLYKFRSMTDTRDRHGCLLPDVERLTSYGRLLRVTSLDELPNLWNVIVGDMSLVGPRPLPLENCHYYNPEQARRLTVLPGLTASTVTNGHKIDSWESLFRCDAWYVDHVSLRVDLRIILGTAALLLTMSRAGKAFSAFNRASSFAQRSEARRGVKVPAGDRHDP
jgi:lipopolysaccharide/colanic/teichoic acid biosynthesis glycosyltransferase